MRTRKSIPKQFLHKLSHIPPSQLCRLQYSKFTANKSLKNHRHIDNGHHLCSKNNHRAAENEAKEKFNITEVCRIEWLQQVHNHEQDLLRIVETIFF